MSDQRRSGNGNDRPVVHLDHLRLLFLWCELPTEGMTMKKMLQEAVIDSYARHGPKQGRYHPNPQKHPKASKPKIIPATEKHKHQLAKYERSLTTIH